MTLVTPSRQLASQVPCSPPEQQWVYQSARCFQLGPGEIGFMTQIRPGGAGTVDLSFGNDLLVADARAPFQITARHRIDRSWRFRHPQTGRDSITSVHWCKGGFIPLGARRPDGSPHPHAGTGFGGSEVVAYPADYTVRLASHIYPQLSAYTPTRGIANPLSPKALSATPQPWRETRFYQFRYDGQIFRVSDPEAFQLPGYRAAPGHSMWALKGDIPDGDDLLYPFTAVRCEDNRQVCGIARWRAAGGRWRVMETHSIPGAEDSFEPSLERLPDGRLLFTCRAANHSPHAQSLRVWCSADKGRTWRLRLDQPDRRPASPVTINCTASGTPYLLANALDTTKKNREILMAWPLSASLDRLAAPIVVIDTTRQFGLVGGRYDWYVDHALGAVVQAPGSLPRTLITHRLACRLEIGYDLPPMPQTGSYLAELTD